MGGLLVVRVKLPAASADNTRDRSPRSADSEMPNTVEGGPPMQEGDCPFCERTVLVYEDPPCCPLCACPMDEDRLRPYVVPGKPGPDDPAGA